MSGFPTHTALTIATVALLLAGVQRLKPPTRLPVPPLEVPAAPSPPNRLPQSTLLDDSAGALDSFYRALSDRRNVVRVVHYGDSPTTADLITGDIRTLLQKDFGDGGHGFVLIAKPWAWYQHKGVTVSGSGWQMAPASRFETRDGLFGLGGVSFVGETHARSRVVFEGGQSHVEVWYLAQPQGGVFSVSADGRALGTVETDSDSKRPGFVSFSIPGGADEFTIEVDRGSVRLFGMTAEKGGPGLVYDSLGLNGASITVLSRMLKEAHWAEELRHRAPQLVIINYGSNEADFARFIEDGYEKELREAIRRVRAALPETSILLMSPMDRGHRTGPGEIETMPTIPAIVAIQRRVARETRCGFFDTYAAMGGEGTMARWYAAQPRLVSADFIHPYPAGGKLIAEIFVRELESAFRRHNAEHPPADRGSVH
jgi:lysophospholipase L1-like esterase